MITIVGIGNTGCNVAKRLSQYPQYNIIEIDEGINVKKQKKPEDYENNCPNFKKIFQDINQDVYVVLSAAGNISGLSLKVLEKLKDFNLNVICFTSDETLLSNTNKLQQKLVINVFQEYARSGLMEKLYLVNNNNLETLLEDVPLDQYYDKLNEIFCYTFHSIMCNKNTKPIFETKEEISEIDRISTFALYNFEEGKKMFFDFKYVTKERYHFSYSKEDIKKDGKLLQNIKKQILQGENDTTKTFAIYEASQTDKYAFVEATTHIVQNFI